MYTVLDILLIVVGAIAFMLAGYQLALHRHVDR
jgi:hypothetical protein